MIESELVAALEVVPALKGKVYPLTAPEREQPPYAFYISNGSTEDDSLGGWIGSYETTVELHLIHSSYKALKKLAREAADALKGMTAASLTIEENSPELHEREIRAFRKIITVRMMH